MLPGRARKEKASKAKMAKARKAKARAKMVKLAKEASPRNSNPARASHPRMARAKVQKARHLILLSAGHVARPATTNVIAGRIRAGRIRAVFSRFQSPAPAPLPQARAQVKPQLQGIRFGDSKLNLRMCPCLILPTLPCPMLAASHVNAVQVCSNSQEPPECLRVSQEPEVRPGLIPAAPSSGQDMSSSPCVHYDVTYGDDDGVWTECVSAAPDCDVEPDCDGGMLSDLVQDMDTNMCIIGCRQSVGVGVCLSNANFRSPAATDRPSHHTVRAVVHEVDGTDLEVIMDSGADVSCLPADLGWLGTQGTGAKMKVSDAQGGVLPVKQHRDVEFVVATRSGRPVLWKEKCVVTSVTQPLLSMGKFMRAGWFPTEDESGMFLRHGPSGTEVPIVFKGNSLMVHAKLRRVTESDTPITPKSHATGAQSSHAHSHPRSQADRQIRPPVFRQRRAPVPILVFSSTPR